MLRIKDSRRKDPACVFQLRSFCLGQFPDFRRGKVLWTDTVADFRSAGLSILPTGFLGSSSRIVISTGSLYFDNR